MPHIDREVAARLGLEAVEIIQAGEYTAPSGRRVDLSWMLDACRTGTIEYPPDRGLPVLHALAAETSISVEHATTLEAGRRLAAHDQRTAALNFASATHPGGGFLAGARAQEESIARSSGRYAALEGREMYAPHNRYAGAMHTDWVIYSPGVPVFRNDAGELLEEPWTMAIVTCPAVNGYALAEQDPERMREIPAVMQKRTSRMLAVAAQHRVGRFVLGAWGCGAFGLDAAMMAGIFKQALSGPFKARSRRSSSRSETGRRSSGPSARFVERLNREQMMPPERRFAGLRKRVFGSEWADLTFTFVNPRVKAGATSGARRQRKCPEWSLTSRMHARRSHAVRV